MLNLKIQTTSARPYVKYRNKLISLVSDIEDQSFQMALIEIIEALKKLENIRVKKKSC